MREDDRVNKIIYIYKASEIAASEHKRLVYFEIELEIVGARTTGRLPTTAIICLFAGLHRGYVCVQYARAKINGDDVRAPV